MLSQDVGIAEILQNKAGTISFLFFKRKLLLYSALATGLELFCLPFQCPCSLSLGNHNTKRTRGNFSPSPLPQEILPAALISRSMEGQGTCKARACSFFALPATDHSKPLSLNVLLCSPTHSYRYVWLLFCRPEREEPLKAASKDNSHFFSLN